MRQAALRPKSFRTQDAVVRTIPAPVGGWNARDSLENMGRQDAIRLINWFPRTTYCEIRGGSTSWATGLPALPETLMAYNAPSGTNKMYAAVSSGIYEVTSAGAVGAAKASCTLGRWQWINYGAVSGTHYLIAVNGQDKPFYFDGTTWVAVDGASSPALTGVTTTNLVHVNLFKNRLFFLEKNKLNFWYLPVQQVSGALTEFVLDSLAGRGGYCMAMATWTLDAGAGVDDFAAFLTSEGEAIVFRGSNPSDSTNWFLIGVYYVGKPLGRNCFMKLKGDLTIIVEGGLFPLSRALLSASIDRQVALTDKINKSMLEATQLYGSNFGWQAVLYPAQDALLLNVPVSVGGTHKQYVMNLTSKAWCEFNAWNAECMLVFGGQLYFGTGTSIVKAWTGQSDAGSVAIVADAKTAFQYFGMPGQKKRFSMIRPLIMTNGSASFSIGLNVDFDDSPPLDTASYTVPTTALWDTAIWDTAIWQVDFQILRDWRTPSSYMGFCAAFLIRMTTTQLTIQWAATDFSFELGSIL